MPFKSKKQKKTIDAAAHNLAFAKKVGIKVSDAKKMSAHGKGQTKFEEARTEVKDKDGKVTSWKEEGDWKKADQKQGRGKVTNLSDKARRATEKLSKPEKEMAEQFETALEAKITAGPNKGKEWSPKTMGPTNPEFKKQAPDPRFYNPDGESAPPAKSAPRPVKKAEVTPATDTDDQPATDVAESKKKPSKIKDAMKKNKIKSLKENILLVSQLLAEAKKAGKCTCSTNEDTCKVHSKMKEGLKGGQKKLDVAEPKGKLTGADFKALKGKQKTKEAIDQNKDGKNDFEDVKIARLKAAAKSKSKKVSEAKKEKEPEGLHSKKRFETDGQRVARLAKEKRQADKKKEAEKTNESKDVYMESLYQKLQNQLNG